MDGDSHTSVVLARIVWQELYGVRLDVVPFTDGVSVDECEAILLIGDKVVNHTLIHFDIETDLGSTWKSLTGLPFVFALWMAKCRTDAGILSAAGAILDRQRRHNELDRLDRIVRRSAVPRHWPGDLAADYLKQKLAFEFTERRLEGLKLFFQKASDHGLIGQARKLEILAT